MSTYSPDLRIELITTGDQAGTWGTTTNTNLGTIIEDAIAGYATVSVLSANQALTAVNGAADEARNAMLRLTTTTGAPFSIYAPPSPKQYIVWNNSGQTATIYNSTVLGNTTAAGTGVVIANGDRVVVFSNGTNFYEVKTANVTGTVAIANGGTGQTTANAAFNALAPSQSAQAGKYLKTDGINTSWDALDISTADITGTLAIANGGTGATTAANARTNLGLGTISTQNSSSVSITGGTVSGSALTNNTITGGSVTGITDLAIADGGTGASDAATARTNLGLGTISTQNSNSVSITGGTISGITDLAIADGGTGASDASTARTNLGLGTMATQNANSVSITGGTVSGITDLAIADGGTGASDASTARTNLGLAIGTNVQAYNSGLQDISGLAVTDNNFIVGNGTNWVAESGATARTSLGLSSMALQPSNGVVITGGSISGITDLAIADGGTGASDAGTARTNLDVPSRAGSGASGTWGISISGNAATATTATTATTVSTTVASGATGTTQAAGTNNTSIATTAFVQTAMQAAMQALHPVGSIYINATNSTNPGTLLGFGTWVAFGAGRVPVGFNAADPLFDTAEETGGSKDAAVVSHTHGVTDPGHTHTYTQSTTTATMAIGSANTQLSTILSNTGSSTTGITINSTGSSGTNANLQPYITVYMWKRTA